MTPPFTTTGLLEDVTIVEIGTSDTLHVTGMLLADQGACVIRVDIGTTDTNDTIYHQITDRAKKSLLIDPSLPEERNSVKALLARADVVIDDMDNRLEERLHLEPAAFTGTIRCTVVPSLRSDTPEVWNDTTAAARAGIYEDGLSVGAPPRYNGVEIAATLGALYAVNAVARALLGRQRHGTVDAVRVPLDRVLMFAQSLTILMRSNPPVCWEPFRMVASPFQCTWKTGAGGFMYLHIGMPRHLRSFLFFMDKIGCQKEKAAIKAVLHPDTRRDPTALHSVREGKEITRIMQHLFLTKSADEWEELLGNAGFCCTKIRSFEEWSRHPQVVQTGQILTSTDVQNRELPVPGALFYSLQHPSATVAPARREQLTTNTAGALGRQPGTPSGEQENDRLPLQGIRVLDLGRVIAGPYCGRLFAEAGAEVLHVSLRNNHLNWEEPFGIIYNTGKTSITLDFRSPEGKEAFAKIFTAFHPDIVVHNFMDDAAKKIGCDYESLKLLKKDVICIDFTGYSRGGPWSDHPGFEQNVQSASGILATFSSGSAPRILPLPVNDISAGLIGSFGGLLSLLDREKSGRGNRITSIICFPSILVHLHALNREAAAEHTLMFNRYFKASDGWFLLSAHRSDLKKLAAVPQFAHCNLHEDAVDEKLLVKIFKTKKVDWWINAIRRTGAEHLLLINRRYSLSKILKRELSGTGSLFSYADNEGFGKVVLAQPPLSTGKSQIARITAAPYPGSGTKQYLESLGIDPARHAPEIPETPGRVTLWKRAGWIIRQLKWLSVIAYRNRGLRGF